jgi:hypothetical protein
MASIAFPIGALQPAVKDEGAPSPNETAGLRGIDPNRPDVAPHDTVTLSGSFPPTQAVQQASFVKIEEFSVFVAQTNTQAGPNAAGNAAGAATAQPAAQAPAQAPVPAVPAQANPAANNLVQADVQVAPENGAANAAANSLVNTTPQQQLQQLDTTLREMGFDPQSISLFNRMGLLLYANDPAALHNLVDALQAVDQQLQQLGGLTSGAANNANPAGAPVQDLLPPKLAVLQQNAQIVPEPLRPIQQQETRAPAPPAQLRNQEAPNNTTTEVFAAQLSFTEIQGSVQVQPPANQAAGANAGAATQNQANSAVVQFQELQLSFQAVDIQQSQQNAPGNSNRQNQGLNLTI